MGILFPLLGAFMTEQWLLITQSLYPQLPDHLVEVVFYLPFLAILLPNAKNKGIATWVLDAFPFLETCSAKGKS